MVSSSQIRQKFYYTEIALFWIWWNLKYPQGIFFKSYVWCGKIQKFGKIGFDQSQK